MELRKKGTRCTFCDHPEHDVLFERWARGELSTSEVALSFGDFQPGSWNAHLRRHVPGWEVAKLECQLVDDPQVDVATARILVEGARGEVEPTDGLHLLTLGTLLVRRDMLALAKAPSVSPQTAGASERLAARAVQLVKERESLIRERELHSEALQRLSEGEWERRYHDLGEDVRKVLLEHPEVYKEVLDRHDAERGRSGPVARPPPVTGEVEAPEPVDVEEAVEAVEEDLVDEELLEGDGEDDEGEL